MCVFLELVAGVVLLAYISYWRAIIELATHTSQDIVSAYNWVANTVYDSIVSKGKFAWDLFLNNDPNCKLLL